MAAAQSDGNLMKPRPLQIMASSKRGTAHIDGMSLSVSEASVDRFLVGNTNSEGNFLRNPLFTPVLAGHKFYLRTVGNLAHEYILHDIFYYSLQLF